MATEPKLTEPTPIVNTSPDQQEPKRPPVEEAPADPQTTDGELPPALAELVGLIRAGAIETLTTDVFDTILWRTVPEPPDAFVVLGERMRRTGTLHPTISPRAFQTIRIRAEERARAELDRTRRCREVRIHEIWNQIPRWVYAPLSIEECVKLELEVERDLLVPDLDVIRVLTIATEYKIPIYAISDIYYSKAQLEFLLDQPAVRSVPFANIFTSSDFRTDKCGALFDRAFEIIDKEPGRAAHIGDNPVADMEMALSRRMQAFWVPRRDGRLSHLLFRELAYRRVRALGPRSTDTAIHEDLRELEGSLVQLRAKTDRLPEKKALAESLQPYWTFGAEVYGPAFAGFAEWVVDQAKLLGAKKVCCLMREGVFLSDLINTAAAAAGAELEAIPLFLNRKITGAAQIGSATEAELRALIEQRHAPTTREFLEMIGVDPTSVRPLMAYMDARLDNEERWVGVAQQLHADPALRAGAQRHAAELRDRIQRLLDSTIDRDEPVVLVDLGWGATIQKRLAAVLRQNGDERDVHGLYMVSSGRAIDTVAEAGIVSGYIANLGEPAIVCETIIRSPEVLEQVCMPDHGTQKGLRKDLTPELEETILPASQRAQAAAVRDGVFAYQRSYLRYRSVVGPKLPLLSKHADQVGPMLARSCADPTEEEAMIFGHWIHDEGQFSGALEELASDQWADQLRHLHPTQLDELTMKDVYWPAALARLRDPHQADLLAVQAAGLVSPGVASEPLETGDMVIEITDGMGIDYGSAVRAVPRRNLHGLSYLRASLRADHIRRFHIELGMHPTLVRIDQLELIVHVQDLKDPIKIDLVSPAHRHLLDSLYVTHFSPRVVASFRDRGYLGFGTDNITDRTVFRIDVEFAFAAFGWDPVREWQTTSTVKTLTQRVKRRLGHG